MVTHMNKVEHTLDETGKIVSLTINGKPAKAGFMRGLRKAQDCGYWQLYREGGAGQNPSSGVVVQLTALELSIYNWCLNWNARYERGVVTPPIQTFDDMKYLLLKINSQAYLDLID